jgi:type I protein arginine methyltransferase
MHTVFDYGAMIQDAIRMDAYGRALQSLITPQTVVLDIGTGTGIFALLACQWGARKVYAIEVNDAVQLAKELAVVNGYSERIVFIQNLSTKIDLPEKADVIISDMRGVLPLYEHHIPSIVDAQQRFLVPNGHVLPQRDTLYAACVEAPDIYAGFSEPWHRGRYGLDMHAARNVVINSWRKARVKPQQLLTEPSAFATLDYQTITSPHMIGKIEVSAMRSGIVHGISVWFDTEITEGITFSNSPLMPECIYGQGFFPLMQPVTVNTGTMITVNFRADLVGDDYIWSWNTHIEPDVHFKQSTFFSLPISLESIRKSSPVYTAPLNQDGQILLKAIALMNQQTKLQDIAQSLAQEFPQTFHNEEEAMSYIGVLARKYSS